MKRAFDSAAAPKTAWASFCALGTDHEAVQALADASTHLCLRPGDVLLEQGDETSAVYLLIEGQLKIVRYTENGHEIWLADAFVGELVGEVAALTGRARTSGIVAVETTTVLSLTRPVFRKVIKAHGHVGLALSQLLARRMHSTSEQMADLVAKSVVARLHAELIRLGTPDEHDDEQLILIPDLTVSALGQRIHATREAASRALGMLERRGYLYRKPNSWTVIAPKF